MTHHNGDTGYFRFFSPITPISTITFCEDGSYFWGIYLIKICICPVGMLYACICYGTLVMVNINSSKIMEVLEMHIYIFSTTCLCQPVLNVFLLLF